MKCPQCGTEGYTAGVICEGCGFFADPNFDPKRYYHTAKPGKREVLNGLGMGCMTLTSVWLFIETAVIGLTIHHPYLWSRIGALVSFILPVIVVATWYLIINRKPSSFAKGLGYSLAFTLVLALSCALLLHKIDNRPPPNSAHSEGF